MRAPRSPGSALLTSKSTGPAPWIRPQGPITSNEHTHNHLGVACVLKVGT